MSAAAEKEYLSLEGLVTSGVVDFIWDRGWRQPTSDSLRAAQHAYPPYEDAGARLPERAVLATFVTHLPSLLAQVEQDGRSGGQYIVIAGCGDPSLNEFGGLGCNVHAWPSFVHHVFGHSVITKTPRVTPMPMAFHAFREFGWMLPEALAIPRTRTNRVLVSHSMDTGSVYDAAHERQTSVRFFADKPWATVNEKLLRWVPGDFLHASWPWSAYAAKLREHDYLAAPVGYGAERIAYWEAMILGTIPICLRHPELLHFSDMPIAFVDRWDDVTPSWCDDNLGLIERPMEKLELFYWVERVREKRAEIGIG